MNFKKIIPPVLLAVATLVFGAAPVFQTKALQQEPLVRATDVPSYPPLARAACVQGSVAVVVQISEDGLVSGIDTLYGHPLLRDAAENAARKWRFDVNGSGAREVLRFTFRILPFETPAKGINAVFTRSTDVEIRSYPYEPSCDDCSPKRLKELRKGGCPPTAR